MSPHNSLFFLLLILLTASATVGRSITVGPSGDYTSISEALKSALPNDKISIEKGHYKERNLIINKPLTLTGKEYPIVDGENAGDIFLIQSDHVFIEGLTIQNSGSSNIKDYAGIKIEKVNNCSIINNQLLNTYFGIYLSNSNNCLISNNRLNGNAVKESNSGNGIHLWKCKNIFIEFNKAVSHRDGIYLEFSENCKITNNHSEGNLRYGLHFMFSHGNAYVCNTFKNNGAGVAVMYTENVEMTDNIFEENWGPSSYGLLLKDIRKSTIKRNTFINNTMGVFMEGASNVMLIENQFISNGWGVKLMGNCVDNKISTNNFMSNTFDIVTNSFELGKQNYTSENYWDKYKGYDLNKDGVGDVPFRPISLFSIYVEKIPYSIVLLRSFMVDLLDTIEQAVPAVIPETLADQKPLMKKIDL